MITCIIATIVASTLKRGSIYTLKLLRRGINIETGREQSILERLQVKDNMKQDFFTVSEDTSLMEIIETFKTRNASYLHVLDALGRLSGIISFRDIRPILHEDSLLPLIVAKDIASSNPVNVTPEDSLRKALEKMNSKVVNQLPVVENNRLVGTLPENNITAAYTQELMKMEIEKP